VLVVHQGRGLESRFLDTVAHICRAFEVVPVVLTLARSEREAELRQRLAEERLAAHTLPADFDYLVGRDPGPVVADVARWRRCSHVFVERPRPSFWRGWLHDSLLEQLLVRSETSAVLALPVASRPAVAEPGHAAPAAALAWTNKSLHEVKHGTN
jgi:K+-sensing histidine kinase KdpD